MIQTVGDSPTSGNLNPIVKQHHCIIVSQHYYVLAEFTHIISHRRPILMSYWLCSSCDKNENTFISRKLPSNTAFLVWKLFCTVRHYLWKLDSFVKIFLIGIDSYSQLLLTWLSRRIIHLCRHRRNSHTCKKATCFTDSSVADWKKYLLSDSTS